MKKTFAALALAAALVLGLTACGPQNAYLSDLEKAGVPVSTDQEKKDAVAAAEEVCAEIEKEGMGFTVLMYGLAFAGDEESAEKAGTVFGAAIKHYCPEYTDDLTKYTE